MDTFPEAMEKELQNIRKEIPDANGDVGVFADDAKLQASSSRVLQILLDAATRWAVENGMVWNIDKCHVLLPEENTRIESFEISKSPIVVNESATYLGVTLRNSMIDVDKNKERVRAACKRICLLKAVGFHRKYLPSSVLLDISRTYVYPLADYGMHLMPTLRRNEAKSRELMRALNELDHRVVEYALGAFTRNLVHCKHQKSSLVDGCRGI